MLAPKRAPRQREIGEQRARLARRRQLETLAAASDREISEELERELRHSANCRSRPPARTTTAQRKNHACSHGHCHARGLALRAAKAVRRARWHATKTYSR